MFQTRICPDQSQRLLAAHKLAHKQKAPRRTGEVVMNAATARLCSQTPVEPALTALTVADANSRRVTPRQRPAERDVQRQHRMLYLRVCQSFSTTMTNIWLYRCGFRMEPAGGGLTRFLRTQITTTDLQSSQLKLDQSKSCDSMCMIWC